MLKGILKKKNGGESQLGFLKVPVFKKEVIHLLIQIKSYLEATFRQNPVLGDKIVLNSYLGFFFSLKGKSLLGYMHFCICVYISLGEGVIKEITSASNSKESVPSNLISLVNIGIAGLKYIKC